MISVTITRKELEDIGFDDEGLKFFDSISTDDGIVFIKDWGVLHNILLAKNNYSNALINAGLIPAINLFNSDLSGCNLSGSNLSNCNISLSNLSNCNLSYSNLSNSNLFKSDISESNFSYSDLSKTDLTGCYFLGCNFTGAKRDKYDHPIPGWRIEYGLLRKINQYGF